MMINKNILFIYLLACFCGGSKNPYIILKESAPIYD